MALVRITVLLGCLLASACTPCTTQLVYGLNVTVLDGASGMPVCDAMVTLRDGAYSETLGGDVRLCDYYGAAERAGTYSIDVVWGAKTKTLDNVRVTAGDCHVMPRSVTITLDP